MTEQDKIISKQAVAELGQTQVVDEVVVKDRSWNCRGSLSSTTSPGGWWVVVGGGWSEETKLILNSTLVKV